MMEKMCCRRRAVSRYSVLRWQAEHAAASLNVIGRFRSGLGVDRVARVPQGEGLKGSGGARLLALGVQEELPHLHLRQHGLHARVPLQQGGQQGKGHQLPLGRLRPPPPAQRSQAVKGKAEVAAVKEQVLRPLLAPVVEALEGDLDH